MNDSKNANMAVCMCVDKYLFAGGYSSNQRGIVSLQPKKASLDPFALNNYHPIVNIPFLSKVREQVEMAHFHAFLEETDYPAPFQFGFRPSFGTEIA